MLERELKFHVPIAQRDPVLLAMQALNAKTIKLHARYYDTDQGALASKHIALRLRKEDQQWVQTIKAPGPDEVTRIELNHNRPEPTLDLSVYGGTMAEAVLSAIQQPLVLRYETIISRQQAMVDTDDGQVELAYDQGIIKSGEQQIQVCELEFEQISGAIPGLFKLAQQWLSQFALILDYRSKAERGDILAYHRNLLAPRKTQLVTLGPNGTLEQAYLRSANECLAQIVRNSALLAGVEGTDAISAKSSAYVHQLRVGIRRLRSCWRLFSPLVDTIKKPANPILLDYFWAFGQVRDSDVTHSVITPRLVRAGMPQPALQQARLHQQEQSHDAAASVRFQSTLLELLEDLVIAGDAPPPPNKPKVSKLVKRLNKWLQSINEEGKEFNHLSESAQHKLRKKVKRLRYNLDFCSGLLAAQSLQDISVALNHVQDTLGDLNDLYVAYQHYLPLVAEQPTAWFALGWLRATQDQKRKQAQADFALLTLAGQLHKQKQTT